MSEGQRSTLLAYLRRLVGSAASDSSDAELLERFAAQRDEAAFEALLRRHGPLVWNVCRRVLGEEHAAEDAFQATFLVLVRKAQSVGKRASIRSWLHGVALRVALRAKQQEQLRRRREQETPIRQSEEASWQDVRSILYEEIQRLPEKYRLPIILCYLEGQTNDEAARLLNCPRGTIATRLARARERLRIRLLRRGVTLSALALAALLTDNAMSAAIPPLLLAQTVKAALMGTASISITTLTEGALHAMFLSKIKMIATFVLMVSAIGGVGIGAYYLRAQNPGSPKELPDDYKTLRKELEKLDLKSPIETGADKKAAIKPEERLQKLLKARREVAQQARNIRYELYRAGANESSTAHIVAFHLVIDASKRLLKAELELSTRQKERGEAREKHLKIIIEIVKIAEAHYKVGHLDRGELATALYEQLDAEIELERAKQQK